VRAGTYKPNNMNSVSIFLLKLMFIYPFKLIWLLVRDVICIPKRIKQRCRKNDVDYNDTIDELTDEEELDFSEIFELGDGTLIGVEYVDRIPDETAFIRIVSDNRYSKQYRKRVRYTKGLQPKRYILVDGKKYFLKKTPPLI